MKKIISILMVLTILVLFALTWYCGYKTEQLFTTRITAINQILPEQIELKLKSYQRNLFSANGETTLTIKGREPVTLHHLIRHFVWGVKMITTPDADSPLAKATITGNSINQLQLITEISLSGTTQSRFILPQFSSQDGNRHLEITGFSAGWDLNRNLTAGNFICILDNLKLQRADRTELILENLKISTQITDLQNFPLGTGDLQLQKLQLIGAKSPAIELQNIQYRGKTTLIQGLLETTADLTCAQLLLAEKNLNNLHLKLTLSGINADLLHAIQQTGQQLQQQAFASQRQPLELQLQLLGLYTELLNSGITLTLEELSLRAGGGEINSRGTLTLLEDSTTKGSLFPLESIAANFHLEIDRGAFITSYQLLNNLQSANGNYQNQAVLAEQAEQIIGGLLQKGIFRKEDGGKLHVDFSWTEGQGEINGKPFPQ